MTGVELVDLLSAGAIPIDQKVEIYLLSYEKAAAFSGICKDIPDGYKNFKINGLSAKGDVLRIRMRIG
ncbi:MAG: hypothetical protein K5656_11185 [Lachnospiraceae bacterium]|nr:hypothetical protein [Lachnospiraceae bacterium]